MNVFQRTPTVLYDKLDGRVVLIDEHGTELITLNRLGTLVWESLDGERDTESIAHELTDLFTDVEPERVGADVERFLAELERDNLVEVVGGRP